MAHKHDVFNQLRNNNAHRCYQLSFSMDEIYTHYAHHAFYYLYSNIIFISFCRVTYFVDSISLKLNKVFLDILQIITMVS